MSRPTGALRFISVILFLFSPSSGALFPFYSLSPAPVVRKSRYDPYSRVLTREHYDQAVARLDALLEFTDEEAARLDEKILQSGGLEPGRIRRSSG